MIIESGCAQEPLIRKDYFSKDSMAVDMIITSLVIAVGNIMGFSFSVTYIKGTIMQSGSEQRYI